MDALSSLPLVLYGGAAVILAIGIFYGWRNYQRCPHCRRVVPRVYRGWLRCRGCGRQYRRGLRFD
ncbi:MAG: hypothetical protein HY215_02255 [Candidatus Rokubacteria bacterium]|nr:hypothetical protein [Candidatus Rokubacteria bacterium]